MKNVVVTGADGFVGYHFIRKCVREGTKVWAIICPRSQSTNKLEGMEGVRCIYSEIRDLPSKVEAFPKDVEAFYHFAWQGVNANDRDDFECQTANIDMSLEAIRFAADLHPKKFIMPGSTNEYIYYGKPIDENALPSPPNAYGSVKIAIRYLSQLYARRFGMEFIYVVIAGIYAADRKDNNVIYYTINRLLKGEKPVLTKLDQLWDYVHIDDVVDGLYLLGEKGKDNVFYTLGRGDNQPLHRYIEQIRDLIDPSLPLGIGEKAYDTDQIPCSCTDLTAITRDTGFVPKIDFEVGIREVIRRMKEEMD